MNSTVCIYRNPSTNGMDRTTHVLDVKPIHIPIARNRIREETVAAGDKRKRTRAHDGLFFHNHTNPAIQIIARNRFNGNEKNVQIRSIITFDRQTKIIQNGIFLITLPVKFT
jgi:hypothetical protein